MPARFRLYEDKKTKSSDRYFIVDSRPTDPHDRYPGPWRNALSMNGVPYHPSHGIGMHTQLDSRDWHGNARERFRNWGVRITLEDLSDDAAYCAIDFVADCFEEKSDEHETLKAFLKANHPGGSWCPGGKDIVANAHKNAKVARLLRQILRASAGAP